MANLQYASDIKQDALFRGSEPIDGTSDYEGRMVGYLNRAYNAIYMGGREVEPSVQEDWWWLRKHPPGVLTLNHVISSDNNVITASVTLGNTSVTLSTTVATSMAGRFFQVEGHPDVFRVSAHTGGTATLTLDSGYTGATNATANFKLMQLEYDLASDVLRILSPMRAYQMSHGADYKIHGVGLEALEDAEPLSRTHDGVPTHFAMVTESKVRFNRYGSATNQEFYRVEYDYLHRPAALTDTTVEPVIPWQYRQTLADLTLAYLLVDKEDSRAELYFKLAASGVTAMARENKRKRVTMGDFHGHIFPRQSELRSRPLQSSSGIIF